MFSCSGVCACVSVLPGVSFAVFSSVSGSMRQWVRIPYLFCVGMFGVGVAGAGMSVVGPESDSEAARLRAVRVDITVLGALLLDSGHMAVGETSFLLGTEAVARVDVMGRAACPRAIYGRM